MKTGWSLNDYTGSIKDQNISVLMPIKMIIKLIGTNIIIKKIVWEKKK
jgi:hypothetical protein